MKIVKVINTTDYDFNNKLCFGLGDDGKIYYNWRDLNNSESDYKYNWTDLFLSFKEMKLIVKEFESLMVFL